MKSKHQKELDAARKAAEKLNAYSDGVFAARGRDETKKYLELNSAADKAIRALPAHLRSRMAVELLGRKT